MTRDEVDGALKSFHQRLEQDLEQSKTYKPNKADWFEGVWKGYERAPNDDRRGSTAVSLERLREMTAFAHSLGLEVHAGHGLTYETVAPIAAFPEVMELNIGHFLIGEAIFRGLGPAIGEMRRLMDEARA